jgi:hypothetical protein
VWIQDETAIDACYTGFWEGFWARSEAGLSKSGFNVGCGGGEGGSRGSSQVGRGFLHIACTVFSLRYSEIGVEATVV